MLSLYNYLVSGLVLQFQSGRNVSVSILYFLKNWDMGFFYNVLFVSVVNQLCVYIYPLPLGPQSHPPIPHLCQHGQLSTFYGCLCFLLFLLEREREEGERERRERERNSVCVCVCV